MVIPRVISVVDDGGPKAPGRVDAGSCDGDGCQMNDENSKPDGERSQDLHHQISYLTNMFISFNKTRARTIESSTDTTMYSFNHICSKYKNRIYR